MLLPNRVWNPQWWLWNLIFFLHRLIFLIAAALRINFKNINIYFEILHKNFSNASKPRRGLSLRWSVTTAEKEQFLPNFNPDGNVADTVQAAIVSIFRGLWHFLLEDLFFCRAVSDLRPWVLGSFDGWGCTVQICAVKPRGNGAELGLEAASSPLN